MKILILLLIGLALIAAKMVFDFKVIHYGSFRKWRIHRKNKKLYDDIWKRPDGVYVDDEGKPLNEFWQEVK